jgi:hypothetical protein
VDSMVAVVEAEGAGDGLATCDRACGGALRWTRLRQRCRGIGSSLPEERRTKRVHDEASGASG